MLSRVHARVIIEMLGGPKEHVVKTLKDYIGKLKEEKTLQVVKEDYADPEPRDGLFSMFVELEMWFKDADHLLAFCFDAMPSSVEILAPEHITMHSKEFEGLVNDLQAKLHTVDLALKEARATIQVLDSNAMNVLNNFVVYTLKQGPKTAEELSVVTGLQVEKVIAFMDRLIESKRVTKNGKQYSA